MRSKVAERLLARTPKEIAIFTDLYADLLVRVSEILKEKGITKETVESIPGEEPSEVENWLNDEFSFTLFAIARLSAELGEPLLEVPGVRKNT